MSSVRIMGVLRNSREYSSRHALFLADQLGGNIEFLSDVDIPGVKTIPLIHNWPNWWSKIELFRPDIQGDILFVDIDTVIFGGIDTIERLASSARGKMTMLSDFYRPERPSSGLMYIPYRRKERVYNEFLLNPRAHMKRSGTLGDQDFIEKMVGRNVQRWDKVAPGKLISYKVHVAPPSFSHRSRGDGTLPAGAEVVCFHGKPRPWDADEPWIPPLRS